MATNVEKYNFDRKSQSGTSGFEAFKDDKTGKFYFHFNDHDGNAFLFSQPYQSKKSRDGGIQAVIKNASNANRYIKENINGKNYFILKSGNHQEIARSKNFSSRAKMNDCISLLVKLVPDATINNFDEELPPKKPLANTAKVKKTRKSKNQNKLVEQMPRHSFRINIYPESNSGKITHVFSGKEKKFKGIDKEVIINFLTLHSNIKTNETDKAEVIQSKTPVVSQKETLPSAAIEKLIPQKKEDLNRVITDDTKSTSTTIEHPKEEVKPIQKEESKVVVKPEDKAPNSTKKEEKQVIPKEQILDLQNIKFQIIQEGKKNQENIKKTVNKDKYHHVFIQLDQLKNKEAYPFHVLLSARPITSSAKTDRVILSETSGNLKPDGTIFLPAIFGRIPEDGFYKIIATVTINKRHQYETDQLVYIN